MAHPIVREELELLARVLEALDAEPEAEPSAEAALVRDLERIRALLVSGEERKDRMALLEQWDRGSALLRQLRAGRRPSVDRSSPYFAHLRLREEGRERDVCLGKSTCIRRGVRVVDWREAPVSQLFYRYRQGESYEEEMGGRVLRGEVLARRTVAIRAGALQRVDAPEGSYVRDGSGPDDWRRLDDAPRLSGGEGAALRARPGPSAGPLRGVDKRLPDIAGLLDPDQFELISLPPPGFLVVRGSAGSGKTTVALHRIAYLAYLDEAYDSPETLFLTLSPALRDYVSHVLPSLGVTRVRILTFPEWAARRRQRVLPRLPEATREGAPEVVRRLKLHPALGEVLAEQVRRVPGPPTAEQVVDDWASALSDPALLERTFARAAPGAFSSVELRAAADWCRARQEELSAYLEGDADAAAELDPEDDALLLRAWQLRVGPLPNRRGQPLQYRHVAVDEVQDFSPLELRVVLDCLGASPSATLAGDTQQQIAQHTGCASWAELFAWLQLPAPELRTLRVSYRSTREIMAFARVVLGPLWEDAAEAETTRRGPPVEVLGFTDPGACVAFLAEALTRLAQEEPLASVAVLTPARESSALFFEGLDRSEVPRLRRVENQRFSFAPGVEVTEIDQAKGLEFDYAVLVDVSEGWFPGTPAARRRLHVGVTRAVHQLWVTHVGRPSPLLP